MRLSLALAPAALFAAASFALLGTAASSSPPSTSAPASASAAPKRRAPERPRPSPLAEHGIPTEASDAPKPEEWRTAPMVAPTRASSSASRRCRAYLVREWLKLNCDLQAAAIRQLAGSHEGVLLWVTPTPNEGMFADKPMAQIITPMRPGSPSVFQLYELSGGEYEGVWAEPSFLLDIQWPEGDSQPKVVLR
jgi:hypothetical protein